MNEIIIKTATLDDVPMLCRIGAETFLDTYAAQNEPEHIAAHLERVFTTANIAAEFSQPDFACHIAWLGDEAVGYTKMRNTEYPPELAQKRHVELERIYVSSAYKRLGIGRKLLENCVKTSRSKGFEVMWLGVWEHNPRAIAFYTQLGCTPFGTHTFMFGTDPQHDILLQFAL